MKSQTIAALLLFALSAALRAQSPFSCSASARTVVARSGGTTELVADVVVTCAGGTPTGGGVAIPADNITLTFNANVTSRILGSGGASEALLLLDEPQSGAQYPCDQANGICTGYGNRLGSGYYGGGQQSPQNPNNRNVFQGIVAYTSPNGISAPGTGNPKSVTWVSIPMDPPGNGTRTLRFTNLRLDATSTGGAPLQLASITVSGSQPISINNTALTVATIQTSMAGSVRDAGDSTPLSSGAQVPWSANGSSITRWATLRFASLYAGADRTRTSAPFSGFDTSPAPVNQDTPGGVYNSESGFFNGKFGTYGSGGNLGTGGLADEGTRYMAVFSNVPPGAAIYVDLYSAGAAGGAPVARLIGTDANGAGPFTAVFGNGTFAQLAINNGTAVATWEVLNNSTVSPDQFDFGVYLSYAAGSGAIPPPSFVQMRYAPFAPATSIPLFAGIADSQTIFTFVPPPSLVVFPPSVIFAGTASGQNPAPATLSISSTAPTSLITFNVTSTGAVPLHFQPGSATTPASVAVSITTLGLGAGIYQDAITVRANNGSAPVTIPVTLTMSQAPVITTLSPPAATAGGPAFTLTVNGANFTSGTAVAWNGTALPTTFVSSTQLTAQVTSALIGNPATASITAVTPDGAISNAVPFTVARLTITAISPTSITAGGPGFTLTITGAGFLSGATASVGGSSLQPASLTATQIAVTVPASAIAQAGSVPVFVVNPGGIPSNTISFTVTPLFLLNSLSPTSITATAPPPVLTLNGVGFLSGATVQIGVASLLPSSLAAGQITVTLPASAIAQPGSLPVTVTNPGNLVSNVLHLTVNPVPALASMTPSSATAGAGAVSLTVSGANLPTGASIQWNGQPVATTILSTTQATAQISASLTASAGTVLVTVLTADGVASNSLPFTINAAPRITALSPATAAVGGGAFTITVTGTGFASGAVVKWNAQALATNVVSATQLTAQVPATLTASAGTATLTVVTLDGVASNTFSISVVLPPFSGVTINAPSTSPSGQDQNVTVSLGSTYPVDVQGTLTLTFAGDGGLPDDPTIQFQNGSRVYTFTVPAGTQPPIQVVTKTGTVAGVITIASTFTANGANVTPSGTAPQKIQISRAAPSLSATTCTRSSGGFTIVIDGFSNTREATTATFDFQASSATNLQTTELAVPATPLFSGWFGSSAATGAGGLFRYTQPFTVQGNAPGISSVSIKLANSMGTSAAVSCQLP